MTISPIQIRKTGNGTCLSTITKIKLLICENIVKLLILSSTLYHQVSH
jgi:hypothetical protein